MELPIVSVIIPAYNSAVYLERAINSVLIQGVPLELIIIDDCSIDNTYEVVNKFMKFKNIVYVKNEYNKGVAESRNRGVAVSKGKYIAYLDADDWWKKDKLKKQIQVMESNKYPLCFTARYLAKSNGNIYNRIINIKEVVNYRSLLRHNWIACSSVMVLKSIAIEFPMINDRYHEDYMNWLMILKKYGHAYGIKEPLLVSCLSKNGKSRNKWKSIYMTFGVYKSMGYNGIKALYFLSSHLLRSLLKYV